MDTIANPLPERNIQTLLERVQDVLSVSGSFIADTRTGNHCSFVFQCDDRDLRYFVRVSWPWMWGIRFTIQDYKMTSEIATMQFLRENSSIPVPQIFHHDKDVDHAVGGEWMVMEWVETGVRMDVAWERFTSEERQELVLAIADMWMEIISIEFDSIGSLHPASQGVAVGPMANLCRRVEGAVVPANPGPFHSIREFLGATLAGDLDFSSPTDTTPPMLPIWKAAAQTSVDHLFPNADCPWARRPGSALVLNHVDFSCQNILISTTGPPRVISVIDWEAASVVPLWSVAPRWTWPHSIDQNSEEKKFYQTLMRERVASRCPKWVDAMSNDFEDVRLMWANVRGVRARPEDRGIGDSTNFLGHSMIHRVLERSIASTVAGTVVQN